MPSISANSGEVQNAIRQRAQQIYERSGRIPGRDLENWTRAEAEILHEYAARASRKAILIGVEGVVYTGEYEVAAAGGYTPGEWRAGDPVAVRFQGDRMFLLRRNGEELETRIVQKHR
ncbi:MAG TPA: DUF2934 domain-containing protein [Candidatus Aquilonibacter sp.]|nr:DUF2934 domain-containing protein [Candidatus Aquilonibacter sp.]